MGKQSCEIEAIGINYSIYKPNTGYSFNQIFSRESPANSTNEPEGKNQIKGPRSSSDLRVVLKDVNCTAKPWEILAVVGPSGAGKSSLLEILAGKLTPQGGKIFVNNSLLTNKSHFKKISGYVTQKDTLFPLLTVEETLMFNAKLRLGRLCPSLISSRVKSLIEELGLSHVAQVRIGGDGDRARGISGGERRRVSIGVDAIHDPKVLILDEPTSGLDSASALQIIGMLKTMAETRGRTIILSIHQPGFRIVKLFNSILLLANGSVLHHGPVDLLAMNLRLMGLEPPVHQNVVEFAMDSVETMLQNEEQYQQGKKQFPSQVQEIIFPTRKSGNRATLQKLFLQGVQEDGMEFEITTTEDGDFSNSRLRETMILTQRFAKNIFRTKSLFACRTIQMLIAGLVLGSIFYQLNDDLVGAEERVGLFAFILTFLLTSTIEALPVFLQEREILMKETSCGSYRVSSYAIANGLVYLPFLLTLAVLFGTPLYWLVGLNPNLTAFMHFLLLIWLILYTANSVVVCFGALVPNFIVGYSVISGVIGSFFLFSGYFISKQETPSYWMFMHYISLFKYPFEGFLINEFSGGSGKCLSYMFGACVVTGEDVLREEGYREESKWRNVVIMVGFILLYRFISYLILRCRCSQTSLKTGGSC